MKKIFVLIAIMAIAMAGAYAQKTKSTPSSSGRKITIQPKIGLNLADNTHKSTAIKPGLIIGIEGEGKLKKDFGLAVGLVYSMEGFKFDNSDISCHLDYINVPIVLNYYVTKNFALKAGIQPGFNVRHVASNGKKSVDISTVVSIAGSKVNTLNLSIPIGLSWETKNLVFDFRYHIGLTEIFEKSGEGYNSTFSFTIGYRL